jgi:hypothetical protein
MKVGITVIAAIVLITSSLSVPPIAVDSQEDGPHCYIPSPYKPNYDPSWCLYERGVLGYPRCVEIWEGYNEMVRNSGASSLEPWIVPAEECDPGPAPAHPPPAESCESTSQALEAYLGIAAAKDPKVIKTLRDSLNSDFCRSASQPSQPAADSCDISPAKSREVGGITIEKPCRPVSGVCPSGHTMDKDKTLCWLKTIEDLPKTDWNEEERTGCERSMVIWAAFVCPLAASGGGLVGGGACTWFAWEVQRLCGPLYPPNLQHGPAPPRETPSHLQTGAPYVPMYPIPPYANPWR